MDSTRLDAIDPPANVLVVHDGHAGASDCSPLGHPKGNTAELAVSFSGTDAARPQSVAVSSKQGQVLVGDDLETATAAANGPDFSDPIVTDGVVDPTDLAAIGRAVSRFCERWRDERLAVCVRSLDALLEHVTEEDAFRFSHALAKRLSSVGAVSHVHFDATGFDESVRKTFEPVFDAVVDDEALHEALSESVDEAARDHGRSQATDDEIAETFGNDRSADAGSLREDRTYGRATDDEIARLLGE